MLAVITDVIVHWFVRSFINFNTKF